MDMNINSSFNSQNHLSQEDMTPITRPGPDGRAALYVPSDEIAQDVARAVRPGAAIVGYLNHDNMITAYFEANRFNDPGLASWRQKTCKAYERLVNNLPTVSKISTSPANLRQIGYINGDGITIRHMDSLRYWLAVSDALDSGPDAPYIPHLKKTSLTKLAL